jgi:hypothetical protein
MFRTLKKLLKIIKIRIIHAKKREIEALELEKTNKIC